MSPAAPESARVAALGQWSAKAARLIDARIGDARAHAWNAITQRVVTAPDGRKTWRQAVLTKGYRAALARLKELEEELGGPTAMSLRGLIRDARAAFYKQSFDLWSIPDELLAPNPRPTKKGEQAARGLVIHGYNLVGVSYAFRNDAGGGQHLQVKGEITQVIDTAASGLQAAVTLAGRREMTDRQSNAILDGWEVQKAHAIRQRVDGLLSDSEVAIYNLVGREMIDPKFYAED